LKHAVTYNAAHCLKTKTRCFKRLLSRVIAAVISTCWYHYSLSWYPATNTYFLQRFSL